MLVSKRSTSSAEQQHPHHHADPEGGAGVLGGSSVGSPSRPRTPVGGAPLAPARFGLPHAILAAVQAAFCIGAVYLKASLAHIPHAQSAAARAASALAALKRSAAAAVAAAAHAQGGSGPGGGGGASATTALPPPLPASTFHPVVFAFYREATAGLILIGLAAAAHPAVRPARRHWAPLAATGACLWANQLGYILGIDLAGVVAAACLQPAIPVFTAALAVAAGSEALNARKVVGTGLAVAGALAMVWGGSAGGGGGSGGAAAAHGVGGAAPPPPAAGGAGGGGGVGWGHAALLASTLSTSAYYLLSKRLLASYPPLCVAAWAYLPAALLMGGTAALSAPESSWHLPAALAGPLAYWVVVCSVAGYAAVAWAAARLPASQVAAFTVLQPFLGTALAAGFLGERLSPWDAGAVGVLAGLALVIRADSGGGGGGGGGGVGDRSGGSGLGRTASGLGGGKLPPPSPVLPAPPLRAGPAAAPAVKGGWGAWFWRKPAVA